MRVVLGLATYNGSRFLPEQLASVVDQTHGDWIMFARDDGSSDGTQDILRAASTADRRIVLVQDGRGRLGAKGSFGALVECARVYGADYFFFVDQDDVWLPDKVQRQLEAVHAAEDAAGRDTPILVHCDLAVVNSELGPVHDSLMAYQRLCRPQDEPLKTLLVHNFVSGCTSLVNRALVELAVPLPSQAVAHDWWVALVAGAAGEIRFLPEAMVWYRQHPQNLIGARRFWPDLGAHDLGSRWHDSLDNLRRAIEQARALALRLDERQVRGTDRSGDLVRRFERIFEVKRGGLQRLLELAKQRIGPQDALRKAVFLSQVLLMRRGTGSSAA